MKISENDYAEEPIRKRLVFYFSGFDPRGASHYHKLYAEESKKQGLINSLDLEVGDRHRVHRLASRWSVKCVDSGTEIDYDFLRWDDIIRRNWPRNEFQLFKAIIPSYWEFIKANWFWHLYKVSWTSALTVAYPIVCFIGLLVVSLLLAALVVFLTLTLGLSWWLGIIPAAVLLPLGVKLGRWVDDHLHGYWQLRTHCAMQKWAYGGIPELDERIDEFAEYIIKRIRSGEADEVLIVGHSAGTILGTALVAKILQLEPDLGKGESTFAFVTLGNCLPLVTFLPGGQKLRNDLRVVARSPFAGWFDFSARRDGACVSVGDLVTMSGVSRVEGGPVKPIRIPVSLVKMFSPQIYSRIKKDLFRVHFQYIMAADQLTDYDYFAITAGPVKLANRYSVRS